MILVSNISNTMIHNDTEVEVKILLPLQQRDSWTQGLRRQVADPQHGSPGIAGAAGSSLWRLSPNA